MFVDRCLMILLRNSILKKSRIKTGIRGSYHSWFGRNSSCNHQTQYKLNTILNAKVVLTVIAVLNSYEAMQSYSLNVQNLDLKTEVYT